MPKRIYIAQKGNQLKQEELGIWEILKGVEQE